MDKSDKKYDIDSLIEEAFIEKGARKQLEALEKQIREKERREAKARQWWIGVVAGVAAGAAVVVLNVIQPWNRTQDVVPGTSEGGTLAEATGGASEQMNGGRTDGFGKETHEAGKEQSTGHEVKPSDDKQDGHQESDSDTPISIKARTAGKDYIASLEPFRSGDNLEAKVADAIVLLKKGENGKALDTLQECSKQIDSRLSELEGHGDDNAFDERQELEQIKEEVRWLTALTNLALGETETAKALLEKIAESDSQYSADASELLTKVFPTK